MSALGRSKNAASAANLEIPHGDTKTSAERTVLFDRVNALPRCADRHHLAREQQISVGFVLSASDPTAQLIEIGQPKPIGAVNNNGVGVGNVESALDDRRTNKHIDSSSYETVHHGFELIRFHLAVAELYPRSWAKLRDPIAYLLD